jgi:hypothetical protein
LPFFTKVRTAKAGAADVLHILHIQACHQSRIFWSSTLCAMKAS